ncbi:class F sortase [Actinophytocola sp.]|uniref:class F sortase n=1 Tax=Actinophytocola sp. TaxID=1872138 RepID=UPI002D80B6B2|nr:class F sortase [Actinophytocola sp.]HET9141521.1 class F sortase [Actinophytocola sp.]
MPRDRPLISPGVAGGVSTLMLALGLVIGGTLHTEANAIEGVAFPVAEPAPQLAPGGPPAAGAQPPAAAPAPAQPPPQVAQPGTAQPQPPRPAQAQPAANTVRLARGGSATLVRREIGTDGVLPIPNSLHQASWWGAELDATTGATVLAGHVNWRGSTGPFAELWQSKAGDRVLVVDKAGANRMFVVGQVITLHKDELPSRAQELFGQQGPHRLVLVTCGGRWVGGDFGYASNQIVVANPIQ